MSSANNTASKLTGDDQVYLYHKLIEHPHLDFKICEAQHADWITSKGYLKRNLPTIFSKSKDRLKKFYGGECKFCCLYCFTFFDLQTNEFNYEKNKN